MLTDIVGKSPVVRFKEIQQEQETQARAAARLEEEVERREEENYRLKLDAILASPSPSPSPSPLPQNKSTTPAPALSSAPINPPGHQPIRQQKPPSKPIITTQMNATWMHDYTDNTKTPVSKRKLDDTEDHYFSVVFWGPTIAPASISRIQDCPQWPKWSLTDWPSSSVELGTDQLDDLQLYDFSCREWINMAGGSLAYKHRISKGGHVFLRSRGVSCPGFEDVVTKFTRKSMHIRHNIQAERAAVRKDLKNRKVFLIDDDEDEVEFVVRSPVKKRIRIEESDSADETRPSRRPCLSIQIPGSNVGSSPSQPIMVPESPLACPPLSASSSILSTGSSSSLPTPSSSLPSPYLWSPIASTTINPPVFARDFLRAWPHGLHVVDMSNAFQKMDVLKHLKLEARFEKVFGKACILPTYHEHRRLWNKASDEERRVALAAGRSNEGLWATFARHMRANGHQ